MQLHGRATHFIPLKISQWEAMKPSSNRVWDSADELWYFCPSFNLNSNKVAKATPTHRWIQIFTKWTTKFLFIISVHFCEKLIFQFLNNLFLYIKTETDLVWNLGTSNRLERISKENYAWRQRCFCAKAGILAKFRAVESLHAYSSSGLLYGRRNLPPYHWLRSN